MKNKSKKKNKHRISLTILYTVVVFTIQTVSIALAALLVYLLIITGVINNFGDGTLTPMNVILMMSVVSLLIGMVLAFLLSDIPLKPINNFITQTNRLAAGDFKARLTFKKPFLEIQDSFNIMAKELENTESLREDFINNFSHEFKTPIVSIAGFAKLLKRGDLTDEQRNEYLTIIEKESLRLADMATNVLNLTKVENQTILSDVSTFNLSEQIRSCFLLLENKWSQRQLNYDLNFDEHTITASEELLNQVWINLIDNAVKFTPENGTISIRIREENDCLEVDITNTGSQIDPSAKPKLFRKFYQADESHTSKGNGIGLAIVKRIVDLHNGEIFVTSENLVTTFTLRLDKGN